MYRMLHDVNQPTALADGPPEADCSVDWRAEAQSLGREVLRLVCRARDNSVVWLDPVRPRDEEGRPVRLGPHLYEGSTGIALFLAALEHASGGGEAGHVALQALQPLRRQMAHLVANPDRAARLRFRLGGTIGLGAYVYAFLRVGRWLGEEDLIEEACDVATLVSPERIGADDALDVGQGAAGAILALLLLDREAPETRRREVRPLERAAGCGDHLLRRRTGEAGEPRAWPANGYRPWCGFAHGAAGIAHALVRLAARTGREAFRDAALEGLLFERRHYDPAHRNWRDLRGLGDGFMTAWCHGAAGVALARLGIFREIRTPEIEEEMRLALTTTRETPVLDRDSICCGNMGRVDILLQASRELGDEELARAAADLAGRVVAGAHRRGHYRGSKPDDPSFSPTLFTGSAGIGYTLLRLADAPDLPSVLALE